MRYDAFLSYSHGDDTGLVDDLERSLARLVRPWYSTRPFIRVQRDTSSFRAGSSLDTVIKDALDQSDHLVCLVSPTYAASPWSNQEIEHWLGTNSEDEVTFAVTEWGALDDDGEPVQPLGDLDWDGEDVPPAVRDRFSEPLAVDLRWATDHESRRLANERWDDAVATMAASIKGRNKDEFFGELAAMRARARIITGAMVVGLLIMLGATAVSVPGWLAARSAQASAEAAAELARADRARAERAADEAAAAADLARAEQRRAEQNAATAASEAAAARRAADEAGLARREAEERQAEAERLQQEAERLQAESEAAARRAADLQGQAEAAARRAADLQGQAEAAARLAAERQAQAEDATRLARERQSAAEEAASKAEARAELADARAKRQLTLARSERLANQALGRPPSQLDLALLLAAESWLTVADVGPDSAGSDPAVDGPSRPALLSLLASTPAHTGFLHSTSRSLEFAVAGSAPRAAVLSSEPTWLIELLDTDSGELLGSIELRTDDTFPEDVFTITPDGRHVLHVEYASTRVSVAVFDTGDRTRVGEFCCPRIDILGIGDIAVSPDSSLVAIVGDGFDTRPRLHVWRLDGRATTSEVDLSRPDSQSPTSVAFDPDRGIVAVGWSSGSLEIVVIEPDGSVCDSCPTTVWEGHADRVEDVHIDGDGVLWSASADGTIRSWLLGSATPTVGRVIDAGAPIVSVDTHQDVLLAVDGAGRVRTWPRRTPSAATDSPLAALDTRPDAATAAFTNTGLVASAGPGRVRLLDPSNRGQIGQRIATSADVVAVLPDHADDRIAYVVTARGRVEVWDVSTARRLRVLVAGGASGSPVARKRQTAALSPDGEKLAVLIGHDLLRMIRTRDGSVLAEASADELGGGVAFVDDTELAVDAVGDGVRFLDVVTLGPSGRHTVHAEDPFDDDRVLVSARDVRRIAYRDSGAVVVVLDLDTGVRWALPTVTDSFTSVTDMSLSSDGSSLAVSYDFNGRIDVFELATPEKPTTIDVPGKKRDFWSVAFGPGATIVAGTDDGTVVWHGPSYNEVIEIDDHEDPRGAVQVSAAETGSLALSWVGDEITTTPLSGPLLVAEACRRAGRDLTEAEWSTYVGAGDWRPTCP